MAAQKTETNENKALIRHVRNWVPACGIKSRRDRSDSRNASSLSLMWAVRQETNIKSPKFCKSRRHQAWLFEGVQGNPHFGFAEH